MKIFSNLQGHSQFISNTQFHSMKEDIIQARARQYNRYGEGKYNAYAPWSMLMTLPICNKDVIKEIDEFQKQFFLSSRQRLNLIRLSLTIMDLQRENTITEKHLVKALKFIKPREYGEFF